MLNDFNKAITMSRMRERWTNYRGFLNLSTPSVFLISCGSPVVERANNATDVASLDTGGNDPYNRDTG